MGSSDSEGGIYMYMIASNYTSSYKYVKEEKGRVRGERGTAEANRGWKQQGMSGRRGSKRRPRKRKRSKDARWAGNRGNKNAVQTKKRSRNEFAYTIPVLKISMQACTPCARTGMAITEYEVPDGPLPNT